METGWSGWKACGTDAEVETGWVDERVGRFGGGSVGKGEYKAERWIG